jgi:hypothetical protein
MNWVASPIHYPPHPMKLPAGCINTDSGLAVATGNPWTKNLPNVGEVGPCHAGRPQALQDTCRREREEEPCIMGPIPSHGPHSALSRGENLQEREEAPRILGPIPSHGPHGALSRGENLQEREEAPRILGPIPSHGPHGTLSRGVKAAIKESTTMLQGIKDLL